MNGQEKSDPAIVAERPTNEAERSASEPAEPRAGAEGKTLRQSAFRTQGRVDASQALERIRQAATLRRQSPEVGAVCGNPARTVLCGGRSAMSVLPRFFLPPGFGFPSSEFGFSFRWLWKSFNASSTLDTATRRRRQLRKRAGNAVNLGLYHSMLGSTRSGGRWPSTKVRMLMMTFSPMSARPWCVAPKRLGFWESISEIFVAGNQKVW